MKRNKIKRISIVIPVFNEASSLELLHKELIQVLDQLPYTYEVIYINDGSTDDSQIWLSRFSKNKRVKVIEFRRNFGQTSAISAGIDKARGDTLVFLDSDLQNNPHDIPLLLNKIEEGFDVVSGWRKKRQDDLFTKKIPSQLANLLLAWMLRVPIHDFGCTLKAYRREYLSQRLYGEMHRLLPYVAANEGARIYEIPVRHRRRSFGKSHYSLDRTFKVIIDMLMLKLFYGYSSKPAYIFGMMGLIMFFVSGLLISFTLFEKVFYQIFVHRNPLFLLAMFTVTASIQFILLGFLTEFIMRTYFESQNKPIYSIKSKRNL